MSGSASSEDALDKGWKPPDEKELTTPPLVSLGAEAVMSGLSVDMVMYNPVIVKRETPYGTEEGAFFGWCT